MSIKPDLLIRYCLMRSYMSLENLSSNKMLKDFHQLNISCKKDCRVF